MYDINVFNGFPDQSSTHIYFLDDEATKKVKSTHSDICSRKGQA